MQSPLQQLFDAFVIPSIEYTSSFISTFPSIWFLDGLASLNSYRSGQCFQPFPVYIRNAFLKILWCLSFSVSGAEHLTCHLFWTSNVPFRHARKIYIQPSSFINIFISKYLAFIRIIHGCGYFFGGGSQYWLSRYSCKVENHLLQDNAMFHRNEHMKYRIANFHHFHLDKMMMLLMTMITMLTVMLTTTTLKGNFMF